MTLNKTLKNIIYLYIIHFYILTNFYGRNNGDHIVDRDDSFLQTTNMVYGQKVCVHIVHILDRCLYMDENAYTPLSWVWWVDRMHPWLYRWMHPWLYRWLNNI